LAVVRKSLGRGLSELLSGGRGPEGSIVHIPVSQIEPNPLQPRLGFKEEELEELAASLQAYGMVQPLVVRRLPNGRYQIVAGERRWRAAQRAGMTTVPCLVREVSDDNLLATALVENLQRADLNPVEAARGYKRLMEDLHLTQEEVAEVVCKDRSSVANTLRLLQLPENILQLIVEGRISEGHGRALLGLLEHPDLLQSLAERVVREGLSVRQTERAVKALLAKSKKERQKPTKAVEDGAEAELEELRERLQMVLATAVRIRRGERGGVIEIVFYDDEQLTRIVDAIVFRLRV
jgi:ParB family chromosome partitioning protein